MANTVVLSGGPSVYAAVTKRIIKAIEEGAGEFVMPWHRSGVGIGRPMNALSAHRYKGVNVIALWAEAYLSGFPTGFWATYKQWQEAGGQVRRGEHGTPIVFWTELSAPEGAQLLSGEEDAHVRFVIRSFRVFNQAQVDGWNPPDLPEPIVIELLEKAEAFIKATGAAIVHEGQSAFYDRRKTGSRFRRPGSSVAPRPRPLRRHTTR